MKHTPPVINIIEMNNDGFARNTIENKMTANKHPIPFVLCVEPA